MKDCDAVKTQDHGRDNDRRTGRAAVGWVICRFKGLPDALVVLLAATIFVSPAQAQQPTTAPDCSPGRDLITIPEVKRGENAKLSAVLMLSDEYRGMWGGNRCLWQHLRYFKGWDAAANPPPTWPSNGEPVPGPTLRARIGDLIQISFMNQIDTKNFPTSLDQGDQGKTTLPADVGETPGGCDEAFGTATVEGKTVKVNIYPRNNKMPNCLHGSSTSNVHFHGTHTTPSTTGDNVLLYIRPALRVAGQIQPTNALVKSEFDKIFDKCATDGSPTGWNQLPSEWRAEQERLLKLYDATAPYKGVNGNLPDPMKLWPKNAGAIAEGKWPQYSVGAFPYCFRLPDYDKDKGTANAVNMGQAPGTHWYHAHKHGSTALNVGNGMTGAFIIEGPYDDQLRKFYSDKGNTLEEKVLVIQQLETSLKMLSINAGFQTAPLSVNGRRQPVITIRPGQVQMWRIVNGAPRNFVQFGNFNLLPPPNSKALSVPCSNTETPCIDWRQTAQDGVQFAPDNYDEVGKVNATFNMAAANRVDLLVKAPKTPGSYALQVRESVLTNPTDQSADRVGPLLTVNVTGDAVVPPMPFIDKASFPPFPEFLKDIPKEGAKPRELVFDTTPGPGRSGGDPPGDLPEHTVDGELFSNEIEQHMLLNSVEEWTVVNKALNIAHPFHIHINPFQVVEVFDPNSPEASDKENECYADPMKPETWDPKTRNPSCTALSAPFVWWDVLAIPSARNWEWAIEDGNRRDCTKPDPDKGYKCPIAPQGYNCRLDETTQKQQCTVPSSVKIPGYFKMRSRFVDYAGVFVQHCHILAHEDIGMMQLIEVYTNPPGPTKKTTGFTHY